MQTFSPVPEEAKTNPEVEVCHQLSDLVAGYTNDRGDGKYPTMLERLAFLRESAVGTAFKDVYEPTLVLVLQGEKVATLGAERYLYSPAKFLVVTVELPISGTVVKASPSKPYLAVELKLDLTQLAEVLAQIGTQRLESGGFVSGLSVGNAGLPLINSILRLVQLLETPQDLEFLAPLTLRELYYHLLRGSQGEAVRQIATTDSTMQRVARVIKQIKENLDQPFQVDDLAEQANMSPASFYRHFKNVTSLSPLQYQKQLRLFEARRVMLVEDSSAASAAYRVGYDSPSQFSREYARLFGGPPRGDISRLQVDGQKATMLKK